MKALSVFIIILLSPLSIFPQQPLARTEQEATRSRQWLQAISMIEQTAAEAMLWDDKKAAVGVLADAADLLWKENPGSAAKWLSNAWGLIDQTTETAKNEKLKDYFTRSDRAAYKPQS